MVVHSERYISEEDISEEDITEEDISEEDISEEDISEEDVSEKDITEEDISEEDISEEDFSEECILKVQFLIAHKTRRRKNNLSIVFVMIRMILLSFKKLFRKMIQLFTLFTIDNFEENTIWFH